MEQGQEDLNLRKTRLGTVVMQKGPKSAITEVATERATRRVIAPYVPTMHRGTKAKREESKFGRVPSLYGQEHEVMKKLKSFLSDSVDIHGLLQDTADIMQNVTKSTGCVVYIVDESMNEIYQYPRNGILSERARASWKIGPGQTVAAYVAFSKELVMVPDVIEDSRFPAGVGWKGLLIKAVLCLPVVTPENTCYAVIELYREDTKPPYQQEDLQVCVVVTGWMGVAIHQNTERLALHKHQKLNEHLLQLTRSYFSDTLVTQTMISEIMILAKSALDAERSSFFVVDQESDELVADQYVEAIEGKGIMHKKKLRKRFTKDRSIAALVARTKESVNVRDAYSDSRFNKEVDTTSGLITNSILCMPILGPNNLLGVVELVNKINAPCFTAQDQQILQTFTVYCAVALQFANMQESRRKREVNNIIKTNMLTYHMQPPPAEVNRMVNNPFPEVIPDDFATFTWYPLGFEDLMPHLVYKMLMDIWGPRPLDIQRGVKFVLTVRKGYRGIEYHNHEHAFNVCHCMYNMLTRNLDRFSLMERQALFVGCYGHDLDHAGFTNNFLCTTDNSLAQLYPKSTLENHHFQVTMLIIKSTKVFEHLPTHYFKELTQEIHDAIIATDLVFYFRCRAKLLEVVNGPNGFDWINDEHRTLLKSIMMTTCDLSGQCKPFPIAKIITQGLYREFYLQGDLEKRMGFRPLSMMDRTKQNSIPEDQVQFIKAVVQPCCELLTSILPNTNPLLNSCRELQTTWEEIMETGNENVWRQEDCFTSE